MSTIETMGVHEDLLGLVLFYEDELRRILQGERATSVLSLSDRRILYREGVLEKIYRQHGATIQVTEKARSFLKAGL